MSPIAQTDGHDAPGLIAETVPSIATQIDDLIVGFEDAVGEEVVAQELPDILDGVQFGGVRGQSVNRRGVSTPIGTISL